MRMMKKVLGTVTVLALLFPKRHPQRRMKTQLPLHSC